jgi:hypothetical protein
MICSNASSNGFTGPEERIGGQGWFAICERAVCFVGFTAVNSDHSPTRVSGHDLAIMSWVDRYHLKHPFYGSRRIRDWLIEKGNCVNRKGL